MTWNDEGASFFPFGRPLSAEERVEHEKKMAELSAEGDRRMALAPRFTDTDARCVKCGGRKVRTTFVGESDALKETGKHESLWRTCKRCGYGWPERCLDDDGGAA